MPDRINKINSLSQRILGQILEKDIDLPAAREFLYSVTDVKVSRDLKNAEVYISVLGAKDKTEEAFLKLNRQIFKIQMLYGERIRLKFTPKLHLNLDTTAEYAERIDRLIHEIHKKDKSGN